MPTASPAKTTSPALNARWWGACPGVADHLGPGIGFQQFRHASPVIEVDVGQEDQVQAIDMKLPEGFCQLQDGACRAGIDEDVRLPRPEKPARDETAEPRVGLLEVNQGKALTGCDLFHGLGFGVRTLTAEQVTARIMQCSGCLRSTVILGAELHKPVDSACLHGYLSNVSKAEGPAFLPGAANPVNLARGRALRQAQDRQVTIRIRYVT
jgi:hypothetical protein